MFSKRFDFDKSKCSILMHKTEKNIFEFNIISKNMDVKFTLYN